jgi:malate synthase
MARNAREQLERGSGPYFYLPKLESHLEARLWADAFGIAEQELDLPSGTIRCTVLIETILAAFEMEEILYELRDWGCALNAGRWDYIFSVIKKFFDGALGERPNQLDRLREDVAPDESALLSIPDTPGEITDAGVQTNVSVGVRYLDSWLHGVGAAAIDNLMEDAATAEISRSQIWQWVHHGRVDEKLVRDEIELVDAGEEAKELFAAVALTEELEDFLTLPAYERLD